MKILVGYDGTNSAKEALNQAKSHAKVFGAAMVDVVTSMEKGTEGQREDIEQAERGLEWAKSVFDEEGISVRWGILFRREINLTYARIQDIHLRSNFIERWLNLARIEVQTASGRGKVIRHNAICNRLTVRLEDGMEIETSVDQLKKSKQPDKGQNR